MTSPPANESPIGLMTSPPTNESPIRQSHYRPRSGAGWAAVLLFLGLMALAQPPFVHAVANRIEPWLLGLPFLYAWLLGVYTAMIAVLIWVQRREL